MIETDQRSDLMFKGRLVHNHGMTGEKVPSALLFHLDVRFVQSSWLDDLRALTGQ